MRPEVLGKELEDDCVKVFKLILKKYSFYYDRIYDTKSAKGVLPPRPGDFYLGYKGMACVLECKASEKHATFRAGMSSLVKDEQVAKLRLWLRAGNPAYYLFRSKKSQTIEIWDAGVVIRYKLESKPLPADMALATAKYEDLYNIIYQTFIGRYP